MYIHEEVTFRKGRRGTIPLNRVRKRFINWLEKATGYRLEKIVCIQVPPGLSLPGDDNTYFYRYRFEGIFNTYIRRFRGNYSARSVFQMLDVAFQFLFPNSYLRICETYTSKELMVDFRMPRGFINDFSQEGYEIVKTWTPGDILEYSKSGKVLIVVPPKDLPENSAFHYPEKLISIDHYPKPKKIVYVFKSGNYVRKKGRPKKKGRKKNYNRRAYLKSKVRRGPGRPKGSKNKHPKLTKVWRPPQKSLQDLKQEFNESQTTPK